jgi:ribosomal subunit interface protein
MQISITGKHIKIGDSLTAHVNERASHGIEKYFKHATRCEVVFAKEGKFFKTDIHLHEGTGLTHILKSDASATDIYISFDSALMKIERQLRRYKERLNNHHKKDAATREIARAEAVSGTKYVLTHQDYEGGDVTLGDNPIIIAEKTTRIETLTVGEAVMKMDLAGLPALLFLNENTGRMNVVYHRVDGNISWVDPAEKKASA